MNMFLKTKPSKLIFKELKRTLRDLKKLDSDVKRKKFNSALKELRILKTIQKKFFKWLVENKSSLKNSSNLVYGIEHIEQLIKKTENDIVNIKGWINDNEIQKIDCLIKEMEKYVIWELNTEKKTLSSNKNLISRTHKDVIKKIKKIDNEMYHLIKDKEIESILKFIQPINFKHEKKKFMDLFIKGVEYNPHFKYKNIPDSYLSKVENRANDLMHQIKELNIPSNKGAGYIIEKKKYNLINSLNLIRNLGSPEITKYSIRLYGFPSQHIINIAESYLMDSLYVVSNKIKNKFDERKYSAKQFKKKAENFLRKQKMSSWKVGIGNESDMGSTRFKVSNPETTLFINEGYAPFSEKDFIKAMKHEILVHAKRNFLGSKQFIKILGFGTSGYLFTEEGLTNYFEELKDAKNPILEKKKYLYVLVEAIAIKNSFYECVRYLVNHGIDLSIAFDLTQRVKRGLINTSRPGGFMKDHVYLVGDKIIEEFIARGGDPKEILWGKMGINDIKYLTGKYDLNKYLDKI